MSMGLGGRYADGSNQENEGGGAMTWLVTNSRVHSVPQVQDPEATFSSPCVLSSAPLSNDRIQCYLFNTYSEGSGLNFETLFFRTGSLQR